MGAVAVVADFAGVAFVAVGFVVGNFVVVVVAVAVAVEVSHSAEFADFAEFEPKFLV